MKYRKLDANDDFQFGGGATDFWIDVPDAPAQAVRTRLALWQGQWFLDAREGMPWKTQVLGNRTADTRDPTIKAHVLSTQGVLRITDYSSNLNRDARALAANIVIDTTYGRAVVSGVNA